MQYKGEGVQKAHLQQAALTDLQGKQAVEALLLREQIRQ